jgi:hypothetical protein
MTTLRWQVVFYWTFVVREVLRRFDVDPFLRPPPVPPPPGDKGNHQITLSGGQEAQVTPSQTPFRTLSSPTLPSSAIPSGPPCLLLPLSARPSCIPAPSTDSAAQALSASGISFAPRMRPRCRSGRSSSSLTPTAAAPSTGAS